MLRKTFRAALSLLLVFSLLLGMSANGLVVLATGEQNDTNWRELLAELGKLDGQKDINYVSLGASNTNGYGIHGYLPEEVHEDPLAASKANLNDYGYLRTPEKAYPALIAEALKVKEENFHQLAISSMRVEEVLYLLGEDSVKDAYMDWRFTGGQKWFAIAEPGGVGKLQEAYQNYLTNADVITIDLGWNNFGVYAFNNIKSILAGDCANGKDVNGDGTVNEEDNYWKAPEWDAVSDLITKADYDAIRKSVMEALEKNMDADSAALKDKMGYMLDVLTYATLGAIGHFDSIVEWIYEHNEDAQIVVINIQNLADDLVVEFEGATLNLGDLYGELIDLVNLYRASESPYADKYAFADAGDVETFLDEIVAWNGDPTTLGENMKDCFDMYDDSLYVRSIVEYMMVGQALSGVFKGVRDQVASAGNSLGAELNIFKDSASNVADSQGYVYEFALTLDQDTLLTLDLAALNLADPGKHTADSLLSNGRDIMGDKYESYNAVEMYGAAVAKHLANLRAQKYDAYDYAFTALIGTLNSKLAEVNNALGQGSSDSVLTATKTALEQAINQTVPAAQTAFKQALAGVYTTYTNTLNYAYDVVATTVQFAAGINELEVNADSLNDFNNAADGMMGIVAGDFIGGATAKFNYELYKNKLQELPEGKNLEDYAVSDYVLDESNYNTALRAILVLAVRYELGNSFFAHPNEAGHDQITKAVLNALVESDAEDFTNTKLELYMSVLKDQYPNLYAMLMGEHNLDDVDDLSIIVQMLKMSGSGLVAGMDLDALEAEIRAELKAFRDSRENPEQAAEAEAACYRLYKKLIDLAAATTAVDYVVNEDSYYVSLGDSTITGYGLDGYVDGAQNGWLQTIPGAAHTLLAKKLFGEEGMKTQFMNYCQGSLRADDLLLFLGGDVVLDDYYYAEIEPNLDGTLADTQAQFEAQVKKADLISVAIGGGNFLTFAGKYMNRVMGTTAGEPYELNWERIGVDATDESMAELQEALDLLVPIIDALGLLDQYLPEDVEIDNPAKFARALAEGLIYGYASYNYYYTQVLERIREINPDAKLLILGMFNPVDDWTMTTTIDGEETIVNIGGAVANLMESANLQTLAFALQNTNASYIDVSDAETILEAENPGKELGFDDYYNSSFESNGKAVHASVAGHEYIADQMYAALSGKNTDAEVEAILEELYYVLDSDYLTTQEKLEYLHMGYAYAKDNNVLAAYPEVAVLEDIYLALDANGQISDEQTLSIILYAYERLLDRRLTSTEGQEIASYVYNTVFDDPALSPEDKINIAVTVYDTLAESDLFDIPTRGDIYDYAINLRDEVLGILDAEWTQTIKDLNTDLQGLYGQLNTLTNTLNNELYGLVELQKAELKNMIAERNALLIELEELEEKLDAARKGVITTYSTRSNTNPVIAELEAAIAETEAAIAALDASIAALSAKIDADLRGVAAIEAAIAQIKAEIGETESALADVIDAIEQLNADLEVVYGASLVLNENLQNIYNLTFGQIDGKAVVEAVKAIVETVPAVVEKVQAVYDKTQEAVENAKAAWALIEDFADVAQGHVDSIVDGVDTLAGLTEQQIAAIKAAAEECKKAVDGVIAENQPAIENALKNTYVDLKTLALGEINKAQQWLTENETYLIMGAAAVGAVLMPYLDDYVTIDFANGKITVNQEAILELIQPYTSMIDNEILKLQGEALKAEEWLKENYPIAKAELNKKLQALHDELNNLEFENPYDEEYLAAKEAIEAQIKKLEALRDQLDAKYQEVLTYLDTVKAAIADAELALDGVIAAGNVVDADLIALFDALTKLHGELVDLHGAVVDLHDAAVEELYVIFGYCGIVADNFVKVLNTLPAYVDVLVHAVELITSEETWIQLGEMLQAFAGDLVDRLMEYLSEEETQQLIKDLIAEYGPVIAEKLLETLVYVFEEYGPEIADSIYNYLYNNPDEVIAFFNEYGDEMLALVEEYGDEALAVIAIFVVLYGDEIADYVIENHEAILGAIFAWIEVHGENAAELIQVYAEALGLCGAVREQIEILKNALEQLEAELESLKAQLENASEEAKKEILEKIAAIEAKIAQVKAAIAQLEAALEAAINSGLAKIDALKEAIENLDEKVLELLAAAKKAAIAEINAAIANVEAALNNLDAAIENLLGDAYIKLKELLISGAEALLDAVIEAVKKYAPELADEIYNYLLNNPDEVIAFFNEYGDEIWALVEKYGDEALMAVGAVLYLYGEEIAAYIIENQEQLLEDIANWISVHGENAAQLLQVYAEALGLCDLVRGEIAELEKLLGELEAELNEQLNTLNNVLMAQLAELEAELARLKAELENAVEAQKPAIEAAIAEIEKKIAEIKAAIEEVKALIADIQAKIEEIVALLPVMNEKLQALVDSLFNLDEALKYLLEAGVEAGASVVQKALDAVADAVKDLVGVVSDAAAEELGKLIDAAKEILDKAYYDATHGDYHITPGESYYVGLGDDLSVSQSFVDLLAATLGVDYANLAASGMSMTDLLYILDENFVADEYTLATFGGDVEALREAYIAELMKADLVTVGVGSFGITDFVSAQAQGSLAMLLNEQLGDWLNNKYFGETLTDFVSQYVDLNATTYTMDWVSYIGEEGVEELNKVLADVRADLIEKGIPEYYTIDIGMALEMPLDPGSIVVTIPVVDLLTMMTESYMYAYVTHLFNAGEVFNLIHQIAPNAELVVVGMFNPMDELVLNIAGTTIALGDYYEYMVEVMNLRYLGYAFVAPNTTFVAVPDAQSEIDLYVENFENIDELLMMLALGEVKSSADASEVGQEYIKDQIMNALNVTKSLLGDVNLDGVVDSTDAAWILKYDALLIGEDELEMANADVNGDGVVDSTDAAWVLKYDALLIDEFPAEQ